MLKDLSDFRNVFATLCANSVLGGAYVEKVASLTLKHGLKPRPYLRSALIKANMASPLSKVDHGVCTLIQ